MKKIILASLLIASACSLSAWAASKTEAPTQKNAATAVARPSETTTEAGERWKAYKVTGDRVIFRTGPGKQYSQKYCGGSPMYFYKGDIVLPDGNVVKNGFRKVYIPNMDDACQCGWVSVQYLKATYWDPGYVY